MTSSYGPNRYGELRALEQANRRLTGAQAYEMACAEAEHVEAMRKLQRVTPAWYEAYVKATKSA